MPNQRYHLRENIRCNPRYIDSSIQDDNDHSPIDLIIPSLPLPSEPETDIPQLIDAVNEKSSTSKITEKANTTSRPVENNTDVNLCFPSTAGLQFYYPHQSTRTEADDREKERVTACQATDTTSSPNGIAPQTNDGAVKQTEKETQPPVVAESTADISLAIQQLASIIQRNNDQLNNKLQIIQQNNDQLKNDIHNNNSQLKNDIHNNNSQLKNELNSQFQSLGLQMGEINKEQSNIKTEIEFIKIQQNSQENQILEMEENLQKSVRQVKTEILEQQIIQMKNVEKIILEKQVIQLEEFRTKQEKHVSEVLKTSQEKIYNTLIPIIEDNTTNLQQRNMEINEIKSTMKNQGEDIDDIRQQLSSKNTQVPTTVYVTCTGNGGPNDNNIPKFYGRAANPNEYLMKLRRYYERAIKANNQDPKETMYQVIENSLESHASRWFYLIKEDVQDWEDFEKAFEQKYWSREVQRSIKQKVEAEKYHPFGKLNRSEYFTERVILLKSLVPPMAEDEIVQCMAEHFSELIQDARRVLNINTIVEFESLLQREDLKDANTKTKNHHQSQPPDRRLQPQPNYNGKENTEKRRYFTNYNPNPKNQYHHPDQQPNYRQQYRPQNNGQQHQHPQYHPYNRPRHHNDRTYYNRDRHNQIRDQHQNRRYPTPEQAQVCTTIVQQEQNPLPRNRTPSPTTTQPNCNLN